MSQTTTACISRTWQIFLKCAKFYVIAVWSIFKPSVSIAWVNCLASYAISRKSRILLKIQTRTMRTLFRKSSSR